MSAEPELKPIWREAQENSDLRFAKQVERESEELRNAKELARSLIDRAGIDINEFEDETDAGYIYDGIEVRGTCDEDPGLLILPHVTGNVTPAIQAQCTSWLYQASVTRETLVNTMYAVKKNTEKMLAGSGEPKRPDPMADPMGSLAIASMETIRYLARVGELTQDNTPEIQRHIAYALNAIAYILASSQAKLAKE